MGNSLEMSKILQIHGQFKLWKCPKPWKFVGNSSFSNEFPRIEAAQSRFFPPVMHLHNFVLQIARSLDLNSIPSAFQIRYGGCKGMLAIDASLPPGRQILHYRKSMRKFDCQHEDLEICDQSKPSKYCAQLPDIGSLQVLRDILNFNPTKTII